MSSRAAFSNWSAAASHSIAFRRSPEFGRRARHVDSLENFANRGGKFEPAGDVSRGGIEYSEPGRFEMTSTTRT